MLLSDLFDQLTYGELSQLFLGGVDEAGIAKKDYPKVLAHIRLGLTALYTRFPLRQEEVILRQYEQIQLYHLERRFAATNTESTEQYKYIHDTEFEPFFGNVLKIDRVFNEGGEELFLNDSSEYWSVHTPAHNSLLIPYPHLENNLSIIYRADHVSIEIENLEPTETEIVIPPSLISALCYFVGSRAYTTMNGEHLQDGNNYMQRYEQSCLQQEQYGTMNKDETTQTKLEINGWV